MKIIIVVDNYVSKRNFVAEHGFSILIETEKEKILLDTGQGYALKHNLKLLGASLSEISKIILSHGHNDHTGGLHFFIEENIFPEIIAHPDVIYPKFKISGDMKNNIGLKYDLSTFDKVIYSTEPVKIAEGIIFSGEVPKENRWELEETKYFREKDSTLKKDPFSDDTSLFVKTNKGLLVLTGCAHSGIINIIKYGIKLTNEQKLLGIIGGMHLKNASRKRIKKTIEELSNFKPEFVSVSHCTGIDAGILLKKYFGNNVIFTSIGDNFEFIR